MELLVGLYTCELESSRAITLTSMSRELAHGALLQELARNASSVERPIVT